MMNSWSLSLLFALIFCYTLGVYSKVCVEDNECHYGRCCGGYCVWHHFCPCVKDNDCRSGEKCNSYKGFRYCKILKTDESPSLTPSKTNSRSLSPVQKADPTSKTWLRKSDRHKQKAHSWETGSKIIVISCLVAVVLLVPLIYIVFKKSRKRPTNVTVLPRHANQAGRTIMPMNPLATADPRMQQGSAACNGATAMEAGAGPCPFKPPGALPPYHTLEFVGEVKGKDDPPPEYDEAVKPSDVTTK